MTNEDKMFELMTQMYSEFRGFKTEMLDFKTEMLGFKTEMLDFKTEITEKVDSINKTVIKVENEHGKKLSALFDGWKQNTEQLEKIEKEVSRQDEVILRKIK